MGGSWARGRTLCSMRRLYLGPSRRARRRNGGRGCAAPLSRRRNRGTTRAQRGATCSEAGSERARRHYRQTERGAAGVWEGEKETLTRAGRGGETDGVGGGVREKGREERGASLLAEKPEAGPRKRRRDKTANRRRVRTSEPRGGSAGEKAAVCRLKVERRAVAGPEGRPGCGSRRDEEPRVVAVHAMQRRHTSSSPKGRGGGPAARRAEEMKLGRGGRGGGVRDEGGRRLTEPLAGPAPFSLSARPALRGPSFPLFIRGDGVFPEFQPVCAEGRARHRPGVPAVATLTRFKVSLSR
jgi:hypothetical protein